MKFDAYVGNISGKHPEEVAEMLAFGTKSRPTRGSPRGRYTDVWHLENLPVDGSGWIGYDRQLETAFFEIKGATTPPAVETIRRHYADSHTVSRLDSCEDYLEPGAYGRLVNVIDAERDPRVKSHVWQPRFDDAAGATTYWGSPQSRVMVRCYEAGKHPDRIHYGTPDWVRAEAQIRPGKAAEKRQAASVSPLDAWGFGGWSKRAAERLSEVEVQRFAPQTDGVSFNRTTLYVARAFRRHFEQLVEDHGDWECVGRELAEIWKLDDEAKAKRRY